MSDEINKLLENVRQKLLDTGTRNRLVHVNRKNSRANVLNITGERSEDVYQILRVQNKKMRFGALGEDENEQDSDEVKLPAIRDESKYTDNWLDTPLTTERLEKRLLRLASDARTVEEEQGVNLLYLSLGFLSWYEDENSEILREAPLILLPVRLTRNQKTSTYDIECRDDDIVTNLSLQARLSEFPVDLPTIDDSEEWTPSEYFQKVEEAIEGQSRWSLDVNGIQLGFFSFAKYLMLRDLMPEKWLDGGLSENPLIQRLLKGGFEHSEPLFGRDEKIDEKLSPENVLHVVDADASQTKVIEEVRSGRNLVVQGPPGTGKSQTITNILAAAAHDGKKVLFVAEKMVALQVVHERMLKSGLSDLCLELHSKNTNKKSFLNALHVTLQNARNDASINDDVSGLKEIRDELNTISNIIHEKLETFNKSPFEVLSQLVNFHGKGNPAPKIKADSHVSFSDRDISSSVDTINSFCNHLSLHGRSGVNPFKGVRKLTLQPTEQGRLFEELRQIQKDIDDWRVFNESLATKLGRESKPSLVSTKHLISVIEVLKSCPSGIDQYIDLAVGLSGDSRFRESIEVGRVWVECKAKLSDTFNDLAWNHDISSLREPILSGLESWWQRVFGKYRAASRELHSLLKIDLPKEPSERLALLDSLINAQQKLKAFNDESSYLEQSLGAHWRGDKTIFDPIQITLDWVSSGSGVILTFTAQEIISLKSEDSLMSADYSAFSSFEQSLIGRVSSVLGQLDVDLLGGNQIHVIDLLALNKRFELMSASPESYSSWCDYCVTQRRLGDLGLGSLSNLIESEGFSGERAVDEYLYSLCESRWEAILTAKPQLSSLRDLDRHELVKLFQVLDKDRVGEVRSLILSKHLSQIPRGAVGEIGIIRGEIAKKTRHKPIRKLMENAGGMIQRIKPVFMMGPISVAQFLPPEKIEFDLLVIDEASQVRPEDSLGAIARAKQIVVVGDQKQLPPTSFFDRVTEVDYEDDDDAQNQAAQVGEMESILSLCEARGLRSDMLEWHYRSRDPSLIAVSNREFYRDKLVVPPCPTELDDNYGLKLRRVSGVYTSAAAGGGRAQTNRIEAEEIADKLSEYAKSKKSYSYGIVAFSKKQANMIEEVLEAKRRINHDLDELLRENKYENVFVKSIETVQGDERDVILVSVGYGPQVAEGRLTSMNFGPVNKDGGERRLNVLFTRARLSCEVFCSFDPEDIDLNRSGKEGTRILKAYLEYAKTGVLNAPVATGEDADSPFEEDVARVISSLGYKVEHQVGSLGFKIDLGVKSTNNKDQYILAVECDGATYHSALWARERDRFRQEILEGFGWKFHRIWSTDWFYRREQEIARLRDAIDAADSCDQTLNFYGANSGQLTDEQVVIDEPIIQELEVLEIKVPSYEKYSEIYDGVSAIEPHELSDVAAKKIILSIVSTEGPIHTKEVARRYAELFGKTRVGQRILAKVKTCLKQLRKNTKLSKSENFWGKEEHFSNPPIRERSQLIGDLTKADFISQEEIIACASLIEKESGAVSQEDLIRSMSRVFGFMRAGPEFKSRIEKVLQRRDL